jgi:hypothetical protein
MSFNKRDSFNSRSCGSARRCAYNTPPNCDQVPAQSQAHDSFYCTPFSGLGQRPVVWHGVRGTPPPPTGRLVKMPPARHASPRSPTCFPERAVPALPLLNRTTPRWEPTTPRTGMRIPLREMAPPSSQVAKDNSMYLPAVDDEGTPWTRLHARPDAHETLSTQARARRLAAMLGQMHRSRHHAHNASLTPMATRF